MTTATAPQSVGIEHEGKLYVLRRAGVGKDLIEKYEKGEDFSIASMKFAAHLTVDMKSGELVKTQLSDRPLNLTDRLLLQSSTRFAFRGEDLLGLGFMVSADWDSPYAEFWAILMTRGDEGEPGYVLCESASGGGYGWVDEQDMGRDDPEWDAVSVDSQEEAVRLALELAQNVKQPTMITDEEWERPTRLRNRSKSQHQILVELCMKGWGQEVPEEITMPPMETRLLRARLIMEEALETITALGFTPRILMGEDGQWATVDMEELTFQPDQEPNLYEIADGCADLAVVGTGTLSACGIPDERLLALVNHNNLKKTERGHVDEHGKFVKPEGHQPPDIEGLIASLT